MSQAGKIRVRITLQERTFSQGAGGQEIPAFADKETVYAKMESLRGRERFDSNKRDADAEIRFTIRHDSSLDFLREKDAVKFVKGSRTRFFDILFINNQEERDRIIQLDCRERPN